MAETAVRIVIDKLIRLLHEETKLMKGVERKIADIKDELGSIRSFLREADERAEKEDSTSSTTGVKTWVKQVREVAYRIEDIIDEYTFRVAEGRQEHQHGFKAFLQKIVHLVKICRPHHEIALEIEDVKRSVYEIKERSKRYGFSYTSEQGGPSCTYDENNTWHDPRVGSLFIENDALVGIESPRKELVNKMLEETSGRLVISLVGMGGIGKTTLAKKVCDVQTIKDRFDCHAWITVSRSYQLKELLRTMIRQFNEERKERLPNEINTMDMVELISTTREYLRDKRYIVVFDDVWKEDFWGDVEHALLDNDRGSRIMVTTRNENFADFCKKSSLVHLHELKPWPLDLAHELLCKEAFKFDREKRCPEELLELSFDIVKRCEGLPLAIVAIGGLLTTKGRDVLQWKSLRDSLSSQLESNPHLACIKRILSLSYLDLLYHLKSCFLYLGIFPEDYSINCATLIRLWIAEGFVEGKHGLTVEEVAREHLTKLVQRNLVQVERIDFGGRLRLCRVHDLMHEAILSRSEELDLLQISLENLTSLGGTARHLSIHNGAKSLSGKVSNSQTHSLIFFNIDDLSKSLSCMLSKKFSLLKELDFGGTPLSDIPEEVIGKLLNLRYLSVRDTKVKKIPKSIGKLHCLQTLDLKRSLVCELPVEMKTLCNMQYLLGYSVDYDSEYNIYTRRGLKMLGGIRSLVSLQKLDSIDMEAHKSSASFIAELGWLKQLRKLGIHKLKSENGMDLCVAIEQMHQLQSLDIASVDEDEFLQLQSMSSPPVLLQRLCLRGRLEALPNWIPKMKNLVKIRLYWSRLIDDPLKVLGVLPNLLEFSFYKGFDGEQMQFERGHFQKLKRLALVKLNGLNRLIIDEETLPQLESLSIGPIPNLQDQVPSGIHHLKSLKTLQLNDMPRESVRRMLPGEGSKFCEVQHIPHVVFTFTTKGARYDSYNLSDPRLLEYLRS